MDKTTDPNSKFEPVEVARRIPAWMFHPFVRRPLVIFCSIIDWQLKLFWVSLGVSLVFILIAKKQVDSIEQIRILQVGAIVATVLGVREGLTCKLPSRSELCTPQPQASVPYSQRSNQGDSKKR